MSWITLTDVDEIDDLLPAKPFFNNFQTEQKVDNGRAIYPRAYIALMD